MEQPQSSPWWRQWICSVLLRHRDSGPGRPVGDLEWLPGRVRCKRCGCMYVWARGKGAGPGNPKEESNLMHPRGGPLPTMTSERRPLAELIQEARGRIHDDEHPQDPMDIAAFVVERARAVGLSDEEMRVALGYLLSAAISEGRMACMRDRKRYAAQIAQAREGQT